MPSASPTALTDLLHAVRDRYRLVHVDETQSVLLLYVERLLRAGGCDALRLRHRRSNVELVVAVRPTVGGGAGATPVPGAVLLPLILVLEHTGPGSATRLIEIGAELGAAELWHLGWDKAPLPDRGRRSGPDGEATQQLTVLPPAVERELADHDGREYPREVYPPDDEVGPPILRRSLREVTYREGQEAMARALRLLINQWEAAPESGSYVELRVRDNAPDPRPVPAEDALRAWLLTRPSAAPDPRDRRERPVFLIVGAPGGGKTTLLRHLGVSLAREHLQELARGARTPHGRAPVLFAPPPVAAGEVPPDLDRLLDQAVPGLSGKMVRLWLELGLCVLLIDGPVGAEVATRLHQLPTLLNESPPKAVLTQSARYFAQGRGDRPARLLDEAVRAGWDLGFLEPLSDELVQHYLLLRMPDPVARSAALSQLARSDNLRRLARRPGLLAALADTQDGPALLGAGVECGQPAPILSALHQALRPAWLEGVAGDRRIERTAREIVARVLARKLRAYPGAVPWWDLLPDIGAEVPGEPDGARLLLHLLRALDDTMFVIEYEEYDDSDSPGAEAPRVRFALPSAADYFTGEEVASRLGSLPLETVAACVQRGALGPLRSVTLSPDGRLCATGGDDRLVRIYEVGSGFLLRVLSGHLDPISALAFSADGAQLSSASLDFTVRVWDVESGTLVRRLVGHTDAVVGLAYAAGADLLVSASRDGSVRFWALSDGRCLRTLRHPVESLTAVALSRDGQVCAVASSEPLIHVYQGGSGDLISVLGGHSGAVRCLALSPDGRLCASGGDDKAIRLTLVQGGDLLQSLRGDEGAVTSLAFAPDGQVLAAGGEDHSVRFFAVPLPGEHTPARLTHCGREHRGCVHAMGFGWTASTTRARPLLATAGEDGQALLWDSHGQVVRTLDGTAAVALPEPTLQVRCLALAPGGDLVAAGGRDGVVRLWDLRKGRLLRELRTHDGAVLSVSFSSDGLLLASSSEDQSVCLWESQSGDLLDRFEGHYSDVTTVAFSPDGYLLASGSADQTVRVREVRGGMLVGTLAHPAPVSQLVFLPGGHYLCTAAHDGIVRIWEPGFKGTVFALRKHLGRVLSLAAAADGQTLASAGDDGIVRTWDPRTGRLLFGLEGHIDPITGLAFSPDGAMLASTGLDQTVRLWEPRGGRLLRVLKGAVGRLRGVALGAGGRTVVACGYDGLLIWQGIEGRLLGQCLATGEGWLTQVTVSTPTAASEGGTPIYALYAADPEIPVGLRVTDGQTSYPASGFARLCHRPGLVVQTLAGQPPVSLSLLQEELAAAPLPMPVLESSGSKATTMPLPRTLFVGEESTHTGRGRLLTADELLVPEAAPRGELVRGAVVPLSPVTYLPGRVTGRLFSHLVLHVFARNLGDLPGSDTGYLLQRNPDVLRTPDVSFVSRERVRQAGTSGFFTGAPDLAAEVVSPTNGWESVEQKAQEYLSTGSRLVWVLDPQTRTVHVHESPVRVRILGEADVLTGGMVLPGFAVPVRDIFG